MSAHHCHAQGCATPCKPELLMCGKHWAMVPAPNQKWVWATYRKGQCDDRRPSDAWMDAAEAAIVAVHARELAAAVPDKILGLTVPQPWAWALTIGRTTPFFLPFPLPEKAVGRWLGVCASRLADADHDPEDWARLAKRGRAAPGLAVLPRGGIVGVVKLAGVRLADGGAVAWEHAFDDACALPLIEVLGKRSLWQLPPDVLRATRDAYAAMRPPKAAPAE